MSNNESKIRHSLWSLTWLTGCNLSDLKSLQPFEPGCAEIKPGARSWGESRSGAKRWLGNGSVITVRGPAAYRFLGSAWKRDERVELSQTLEDNNCADAEEMGRDSGPRRGQGHGAVWCTVESAQIRRGRAVSETTTWEVNLNRAPGSRSSSSLFRFHIYLKHGCVWLATTRTNIVITVSRAYLSANCPLGSTCSPGFGGSADEADKQKAWWKIRGDAFRTSERSCQAIIENAKSCNDGFYTARLAANIYKVWVTLSRCASNTTTPWNKVLKKKNTK